MSYQNACGKWSIDVSPPHPCWVKIEFDSGSNLTTLRNVRIEDLRDLRYLIDRAIERTVEKHGTNV